MFKGIKNQFLRFALNLAVLILILFVIDRVAGNITKRFYFSQVAGANYRTTYAMDSTTADILVFGSSRASHHYVPEVFEDNLKMSFYNTGRDGNYLLYNAAIFQAIIKRYKPKIIIFDINPGDFYYNKDEYERLSSLLPYYKGHPEIRHFLNMRSPFEKYKLLSAIYPYNSCLITIAMRNLEYFKVHEDERKGYLPLYTQTKDLGLSSIEFKGIIDSVKLQAVESIMIVCKKKNIKLITIISPFYAHIENDISCKIVSNLSQQYNAEYVSFISDSNFLNNSFYFQDMSHLNNVGATLFSSIVADLLNKRNNAVTANKDFKHFYN